MTVIKNLTNSNDFIANIESYINEILANYKSNQELDVEKLDRPTMLENHKRNMNN